MMRRSALVMLAGFTLMLPVARGADGKPATAEPDAPALRGQMKHRAVAEFPLPRDRTRFGIGEEVEYWLEPRDAEGPDAIIGWRAEGGVVYPAIGPATVVTLGMEAGSFSVTARRRERSPADQKGKSPAAVDLKKWARAQSAAFPKGERDPLENGLPVASGTAKKFNVDLYVLDSRRKGTATAFAEVDALGRELLDKNPGAKERGQINYMLAHVHAQSGLVHPQRVIEYAQKALAQPLEPLQVPRMYVYWGDAVQVSHGNQPLTERRKWAAVVYLAGLRELLQHPLPAKAPELPGIERGLIRDARPGREMEEARRIHAKQMEARRRAEFVGAMIQHRNILTGQLAALYGRMPVDYDELRELAGGVLRDERMVTRFLRAVKGAPWDE
jgi:hypothetical protein